MPGASQLGGNFGPSCTDSGRSVAVEGVPFFIIDGKITLSGAQPPDAFLEAFRQAT